MEVFKCVHKYVLLVIVIEVIDVVVGWWRYGNVGILVGDQFTCKWTHVNGSVPSHANGSVPSFGFPLLYKIVSVF